MMGLLAVFNLLALLSRIGPAVADAPDAVLEALDATLLEEEARKILEPFLDNLKGLDSQPQQQQQQQERQQLVLLIEKLVERQWWSLARDLVAKSHAQEVDLSFAVRKAIKTLKDEADELLRTLNPKYGLAQQVSPAFQWAQNDTCIFFTVKYTVRWNAPGALSITEPSVNISGNGFNFSGLGKHSNNKYRYWLSLNLFDRVDENQSSWNAASVGKLSVTLRKRWARKWPRLLANKKTKIGNMHQWSERQDTLDHTLSGLSLVTNSPVTCASSEKLYCLVTDTCKKAENCTQCPGKTVAVMSENLCAGKPTEKAHLSLKDVDMDEHELGGEVKITKARNDFDIDHYEVFFGKDDHSKLELLDGSAVPVGKAPATGTDVEVKMPLNTAIPEGATHLLVFSTNSFGSYGSPGSMTIVDAVLPKSKPSSLEFEDMDGDLGEVQGTVTIGRAEDESKLDDYVLHWGKSDKRKIAGSSYIGAVKKYDNTKGLTYSISTNTKIPDGATHLLAFSKNTHGDYPTPASVQLVDHTRPCLAPSSPDCPTAITVTPDADPDGGQAQMKITVQPASTEKGVMHYAVYWGRSGCDPTQKAAADAKSQHIIDVEVGSPEYELPANTKVPSGSTHVLVFARNRYGESDFCASAEFTDSGAAEGGNQQQEL